MSDHDGGGYTVTGGTGDGRRDEGGWEQDLVGGWGRLGFL